MAPVVGAAVGKNKPHISDYDSFVPYNVQSRDVSHGAPTVCLLLRQRVSRALLCLVAVVVYRSASKHMCERTFDFVYR